MRFSEKYQTFNDIPTNLRALSFSQFLRDWKNKHKIEKMTESDGGRFLKDFNKIWVEPYKKVDNAEKIN